MSAAIENIKAARLSLVAKRPYFTSALFALNARETTDIPTLAVDMKWNLYYNPEFTESMSRENLEAILVHEIMHLLRLHHIRAVQVNAYKELWNLAADAEINDDLLADGMKMPKDLIYPKTLETPDYPKGMPDNMLAEEYYAELLKHAKVIQVAMPGQAAPGQGNCGSSAHGQQESWEDGMENGEGLTECEAEMVRREVADAVSKQPGNVPGYLQRWAEEVLGPPKVDWRKELFSNIKSSIDSWKTGSADYTFAKRNRRHHDSDVIFPSMFDTNPKIAIVIDTSGSIAGEDLNVFLSEISGILSAIGHDTVRVLACDAEVHEDLSVRDVRDLHDRISGGGGTDMGVAIEHLEKDNNKPHICIVLTDGYTPWPHDEPSFQTIAVITTSEKVPSYIKPIWLDGYNRQ
jgi:predicted metal-dependent peptidase